MVLGGKNSKDQNGASLAEAAAIFDVMCAGSDEVVATLHAALEVEAIFRCYR